MTIDLINMAKERGANDSYIKDFLMVKERALLPLWEDTVTLAVNAANSMLTEEDRKDIGIFIVATESGLDQEKAVSTWAHEHLRLLNSCRVLEIKVACHAGAAALRMALSWVYSGLNKGKKALIVCADSSYNMIGNANAEYALGGGAVAMLISDDPEIVEVEVEKTGIYTDNVTDVIRPFLGKEVAYDVEGSLLSYLDGLENSYSQYLLTVPHKIDWDTYFDYHIYHVPFPGISQMAHKSFLEINGEYSLDKQKDSFNKKVFPSLYYAQHVGGTYAGSIFIALFSMIAKAPKIQAGNRIGIYSYGSGSCAEYFSVIVSPKARQVVQKNCQILETLLSQRHSLSVKEYEDLENFRASTVLQGTFSPEFKRHEKLIEEFYKKHNFLRLTGVENYKRSYEFVK